MVDGTDNFPARYLVNDACVLAGKPFVYGGILRFEGQCSFFALPGGPCYRCLFREPPRAGEVPSCAEAGVIGVLPGIIGTLQANEAIKWVCGMGELLKGRLLILDALGTRFREVAVPKDPACPVCGKEPTIRELTDEEQPCQDDGTKPPDEETGAIPKIDAAELQRIITDRSPEEFYLLDVREPREWEIARIEGAVLKPLGSLPDNYEDIPKDKPVYVYCKMGMRSYQAILFLQERGYRNLIHFKGGIDAWAQDIDKTMPTY